ncbi:type II CRISPR-associated endonuclease Cas1 [Leptolyngbya sp. 15MV]|nr:type II CRISPR-associated endonuclease Cas1 [Leptolyngbya sp. 15MV]
MTRRSTTGRGSEQNWCSHGNNEAVAAAAYWPALFRDVPGITQPFRRIAGDRSAPPPNNLLDYGYAALRATIARAIVSAGLLPALGIKHRGRGNPFCLADDLMEPFRPLMDSRVKYLAHRGDLELDQPTKAELLQVLAEPVYRDEQRSPLMLAAGGVVASLVDVLAGNRSPDDLTFPSLTPTRTKRHALPNSEFPGQGPMTENRSTFHERGPDTERQK